VWLHQHLVHIFPCLAVIVIFAITDIKIKAGHSKVYPLIGVIFGSLNCYHVRQTGEPTYWFLTWEDYTSALNIGIVVAVITAFFCFLAVLTDALKSTKGADSVSPVKKLPLVKSLPKKKACPECFRKKSKKQQRQYELTQSHVCF